MIAKLIDLGVDVVSSVIRGIISLASSEEERQRHIAELNSRILDETRRLVHEAVEADKAMLAKALADRAGAAPAADPKP